MSRGLLTILYALLLAQTLVVVESKQFFVPADYPYIYVGKFRAPPFSPPLLRFGGILTLGSRDANCPSPKLLSVVVLRLTKSEFLRYRRQSCASHVRR